MPEGTAPSFFKGEKSEAQRRESLADVPHELPEEPELILNKLNPAQPFFPT